MIKCRLSTALMITLAVVLLASPALANCAGNWPLRWQMPIQSSHYGKSLKAVLGGGGFYPLGGIRNTDNRLSFRKGPDGRAGIRMNNPRGENAIVSFDTAPLDMPGAERACISADVFFPKGFEWGTAGTKLGVGLWGGQSFKRNSGGIPPQLQEGWSVRIINSARGARGYAYHLNRDGKLTSESRCKPYKCEYGETMGGYVKLRTGSWNNIQIEVRMNTIGSANGVLKIWINGQLMTSHSNIMWRKKSTWGIAGLKFTDMWGGDTSARKNFSPRSQEMFYRNFRLYADKRGSPADVSKPIASGSGSSPVNRDFTGSFGPISPMPRQTVASLPVISWRPHAKATRYRVRLVEKSAKADRLLQIYSTNEAGCTTGAVCAVTFSGRALRAGRYRLMLRALQDSKNLDEQHFDFNIDASGDPPPATSLAVRNTAETQTRASSSTGSLRPIFPTAGQNVTAVREISWNGEKRADRYRIRLVDKTAGKDRFLKVLSASQVQCSSGGTCKVRYDGRELRAGRHRLIVKAMDGSRSLREIHFDFKVRGG